MYIDNPLYQDEDISIENFSNSSDMIAFNFISKNNPSTYYISKEEMNKIANSPRSEAKSLIKSLDSNLLLEAKNRGLTIDYLGLSIASAYREFEKQFEKTIESVLFEE